MAQITNDRAADRPRLRLIPGGQAAAAHREEERTRRLFSYPKFNNQNFLEPNSGRK